jgi:hypothetical protein
MANKTEVRIGVLRHEVTQVERHTVQRAYPGQPLTFVRIDSANSIHHDDLCREHNVELVILPSEKPIPTDAMKRGIPHITIRDGKLQQLVGFDTHFEPFNP